MKKKLPQQPCLATTYAYNATLACGRPAGHNKKKAAGFTWGEGHSESLVKGDGPTYRPVPYTAFQAGSEVRTA